ncbi:hypothetical protein JVX93_16030 [Mycolicibacterium boenickei]|nr:hypothetical protein JVX93_16030 [Mycolicibacterium boenickei]
MTMDSWEGTGIQVGGDVRGLVVGGDFHFNSMSHDPAAEYVPPQPPAEYQAAWSWKSPITMATLTWLSVILGFVGVIAGWQGLRPVFGLLSGSLGTKQPPSIWPLALFFAALCVVAIALGLRRIIKHGIQWFPPVPWLPVVTGWDGHVGFARLDGMCPRCDGRLKFYDKPTRWIDFPETGKRKITERTMAAECTRNSDHWWSVDKTDNPLS